MMFLKNQLKHQNYRKSITHKIKLMIMQSRLMKMKINSKKKAIGIGMRLMMMIKVMIGMKPMMTGLKSIMMQFKIRSSRKINSRSNSKMKKLSYKIQIKNSNRSISKKRNRKKSR